MMYTFKIITKSNKTSKHIDEQDDNIFSQWTGKYDKNDLANSELPKEFKMLDKGQQKRLNKLGVIRVSVKETRTIIIRKNNY